MPTERFQSHPTVTGDLEIVPGLTTGTWVVSISHDAGAYSMAVAIDWADLQRLGLFVNRETRRHAKELQGRRGA